MSVRFLARGAVIGAVAVSLASVPAAAQSITFSTSGAFSGGSCVSTLCLFGGYVLNWSGASQAAWTPPTDVSLGKLGLTCYMPSCNGGSILAGSSFTLTISQSGSSSGTGSVAGVLGWNSGAGQLTWTPNQESVTIAGVTYGLTTNNGAIYLTNPTATGVTTFTSINDDVTTTPEPATVALVATGFLGLIPVARRRRRRQ